MAKKDKQNMAETPVVETQPQSEAPKVEALLFAETKQPQTVLNLDTMQDEKISVVYSKVMANDKAPAADQLAALNTLVSPVEKQIDALAKFATSENYRAGKESALSAGNYMNSALRSALTQIMGGIAAFSENKAGDNFDYWIGAYKDAADPGRQAKAKKLLDRARLLVDTEEFGTM